MERDVAKLKSNLVACFGQHALLFSHIVVITFTYLGKKNCFAWWLAVLSSQLRSANFPALPLWRDIMRHEVCLLSFKPFLVPTESALFQMSISVFQLWQLFKG